MALTTNLFQFFFFFLGGHLFFNFLHQAESAAQGTFGVRSIRPRMVPTTRMSISTCTARKGGRAKRRQKVAIFAQAAGPGHDKVRTRCPPHAAPVEAVLEASRDAVTLFSLVGHMIQSAGGAGPRSNAGSLIMSLLG